MAKNQTPEQRFKQLFVLSYDKSTTQAERDVAQRKWHEWLKRHGKEPIDIPSILAQAERDDEAAKPPPPQQPPPVNPFAADDNSTFNPATLVEEIAIRYLTTRPHVRVVFTLWIVATHVYVQFRVAPRILLTSENPNSGKTTALEIARSLMFRANEEAFASDAAIRDHLDQGPGSIALDEGDLADAPARRALLRLWNSGHTQGAKHAMIVGGRRKVVSLYAPMIAAGLGRILGQAQLSRTFVLRLSPYGAGEKPEFEWWAPAKDGPDSIEARKETTELLYQYLRNRAGVWKLNPQPPVPAGVERRDADNVRSLLAVADMCGGDWPRRARGAIVALMNEMNAEQPQVIILRHGLLLFNHFDTAWLEVGHFNKELCRLSKSEFDWNQYRGASGLDMHCRPISISEQGRLLGASGVKAHSKWPPGLTRSQRRTGDCMRVFYRVELEAALREAEPSSPVLRLVRPPAE